jgi:endonuclease-3
MTSHAPIKKVLSTLNELYSAPGLELHYSTGFQLLIAVILSAQCTDQRVNVVTESLFKKYKTAEDFLNAPLPDLEKAIKPTGFYRQKAKTLQACCRKLLEDFGGNVPRSIDEMSSLPGVGRKTATMVLGNAFQLQQGIAVDTHVKRVVNRLQISQQENPDKIEKELMDMIQQEKWTFFSNAMILFGRKICQARKPRCPACPFLSWCPYPDKTR